MQKLKKFLRSTLMTSISNVLSQIIILILLPLLLILYKWILNKPWKEIFTYKSEIYTVPAVLFFVLLLYYLPRYKPINKKSFKPYYMGYGGVEWYVKPAGYADGGVYVKGTPYCPGIK